MARILISDAISEEAIEFLKNEKSVEYTFEPRINQEDLLTQIPKYDALIVRSRTKVTREVISKGQSLRIVARAGVGLDNIDVEAAKERNIKVVNAPDALTNAVAEFTLGLMLCLARKIPKAAETTSQGKWEKSSFEGEELHGKTYGTIGIGRIGAKVAELARAFGMNVMANDVIPISQDLISRLGISMSTQEEIFSKADFVDLHVPLTPNTTGLVNYGKLARMKKTAYLLNTSRGRVVDEKDLAKALDEGLLAGAALDVFETEPPARSDLLKRENVITTPHIAGQSKDAQIQAGKSVMTQVLSYLSEA